MLTIIKITVLHFQIYIMMIEVNVVNILKTGVLKLYHNNKKKIGDILHYKETYTTKVTVFRIH